MSLKMHKSSVAVAVLGLAESNAQVWDVADSVRRMLGSQDEADSLEGALAPPASEERLMADDHTLAVANLDDHQDFHDEYNQCQQACAALQKKQRKQCYKECWAGVPRVVKLLKRFCEGDCKMNGGQDCGSASHCLASVAEEITDGTAEFSAASQWRVALSDAWEECWTSMHKGKKRRQCRERSEKKLRPQGAKQRHELCLQRMEQTEPRCADKVHKTYCADKCWLTVELQLRVAAETGTDESIQGNGVVGVRMDQLEARWQALERKAEAEQADTTAAVAAMQHALGENIRVLMQVQAGMEERTRRDGQTGLVAVRDTFGGPEAFHGASFNLPFLAMHNHANHRQTIGMGELAVALNGVAFRTRHNDYKLQQRVADGKLEQIDLPQVPASVLAAGDVAAQVAEMQEYFRAWQTQDASIRDYKPHFRANLCYLEGSWEWRTSNELTELGESDRHHLEAHDWLDLQEKVAYFESAGTKNMDENVPYLPAKIFDVVMEDGKLVQKVAQWHYQVLCKELPEEGVELARFRPVVDESTKAAKDRVTDFESTRYVRYRLDEAEDLEEIGLKDKQTRREYLDTLMEQVAGRDGEGAVLEDELNKSCEWGSDCEKPLNTTYYSRYYTADTDASGRKSRRRGFNDRYLFAAMTSDEKVAGHTVTKSPRGVKPGQVCKDCERITQRWTYAIPLEVVFTTPLANWNPHGIAMSEARNKGAFHQSQGERNGCMGKLKDPSADCAWDSAHVSQAFYLTPAEFFNDCEAVEERDPADTSVRGRVILDKDGVPRNVQASGTWITTPCVSDLGRVRTRFPIAPVAAEGEFAVKELKAVEASLQQQVDDLKTQLVARDAASNDKA